MPKFIEIYEVRTFVIFRAFVIFFAFLAVFAGSCFFGADRTLAAVGISSNELQEAADIVTPPDDGIENLPGYSSFSLKEVKTISNGFTADYEARLSSDPWWEDELPRIKLMVLSYGSQDSAHSTFDRILDSDYFSEDRDLLWHNERTLLYESEESENTDIFGLTNAEFFSMHMIHINGNLLYQASFFREDGELNQENLQTYAQLSREEELIENLLNDLIEDTRLGLGILFPPTGTELSTKSEKSSLALSELYSIPKHGTISFDLYVGELDGAIGTVLDSSGISEASEGDLYLYLSNDGKLYGGIYAPELDADCIQESGWYRVSTENQIHPYEWNSVEFNYGVGGFQVKLNDNSEASCSVSQPRSEKSLYFGDFPGDSIEESMIGYLNNLDFEYSLTHSGLIWDEVLDEQLFLDLPNTDVDLDAFQFLKEEGVFTGSDGMLYPDKELNRVEMLKILLKAYDYEITQDGSIPFWDVDEDAWYLKYLITAYQIGMVEGNPDGGFAPGNSLNRAEFFTMLSRVSDFEFSDYEDLAEKERYEDVEEENWYAEAAAFAAASGFPEGNYFYPEKNLSRREAAKVLYNLLK